MKEIVEFLTKYSSYFKLSLATLIPVVVTIIFYYLKKKNFVKNMPYMVRQVIVGVVFGGIAVLGTEWGIPMNGAQVNCRDAAPLIAGLFFGGPAGIIAGIIGGVERWFAVYWGVGTVTRVACSVSTIIAGFYAAGLRKFVFENRRPTPMIALATGAVMEIFHLNMVLVTNLKSVGKTVGILQSCTLPLVIANSASVMIAALFFQYVKRHKKEKIRASEQMQGALLICMVVAFIITSIFMSSAQTSLAKGNATKYLSTANRDIKEEAREEYARDDSKGLTNIIVEIVQNRHVLETGYTIIAEKDGIIRQAPDGIDVESVVAVVKDDNMDTLLTVTTEEGKMFAVASEYEDLNIISILPCEEAYELRDFLMYFNTYMEVLVFAAVFVLTFFCAKRYVVRNVEKINEALHEITSGNLNKKVEVNNNAEFESLSGEINDVVSSLKNLMDEAEKKIAEELETAKNIQASALPSIFPAYPGRKEFDIYATMTPAKEVGGDFYDFYLTEDNKLCITIADVSGKGVPAAMFMMRAKTLLKSYSESGLPMNKVLTEGNKSLCEGNDAGMFVTAWTALIDLQNGKMDYSNAGHNPPVILRDGRFEFMKSRPGLVLAGMDGSRYKSNDDILQRGDVVFLYTDGVTEAMNKDGELYGEDRLLRFMNSIEYSDMQDLCQKVKDDVYGYLGTSPQNDDITMLAFKYVGLEREEMEYEEAEINNIPVITEKIETIMEKLGYLPKTIVQMNIAIDEIYSNIVRYAYGDKKGYAKVIFEEKTNPEAVMLTFIDDGIPYNPVKKEDPDTTLSAEDRKIGGLGIYMVKKTMDEMTYEFKNNKNVLHLYKKK